MPDDVLIQIVERIDAGLDVRWIALDGAMRDAS